MTDLPALRPYQKEAIEQAVANKRQLLAIVMGGGKSVCAIETIERLAESDDMNSGCVFALNSIKYQWKREIERWAPNASIQVIDGKPDHRKTQYKRASKFRYNILGYSALNNDWELVKAHLPIDWIVADEVQAVKGFKAQRSRRLKALGKYAGCRIGMSGQPVENRPEELYSIMEFVDPEVLGPFTKFDRTFITRDSFGRPQRYKNLNLLHDRLKGTMYRVSREAIAEYLPSIVNVDLPVPLDDWSQKLYDDIAEELLGIINVALAQGMGGFDLLAHYGRAEDAESNRMKGQIMSRVTAMRLLVDHPQLLLGSATSYDDPNTALGSEYASTLNTQGRLKSMPKSSTKLDALISQVEEILEEDPANKVVVFSGFKPMLTLIGKALSTSFVRIDGDVPAAERDEHIQKFNKDKGCRVFLSSDAGNYGVNLDSGSHLISYDLPWSAGAFAQRVARIDRLSSIHDTIYVSSLYGTGTIEERQMRMLDQKKQISEAFVDQKYSSSGVLDLELSSLREFLQEG